MTYAISDIHGCYEEYIKLLEKINLSEDDTLYILGDICDRGEKPMEIYNDIMARDNVISLFGNHEHLAYINLRHLIKNDVSKLTKDERLDLIDWLTRGGKPTFSEFISLSKADRMDFIEFLKSFSMYEDITINGKRFVLVVYVIRTSISHFEVIFKGLVYFVNIKLPVSFKAVCAQPST